MNIVRYSETNLPTVEDIRTTWCLGIPLYDSKGNELQDASIQKLIDGAIDSVERYLGIYLKPTVIATNPEERGLIKGVDYEKAEPAYDYDAKEYANWGFLQLRERHVQELGALKLVLPNGQVIIDFMTRPEWVKLYKEQGQIHIVPYTGDPTVFYLLGGSQTGYPFVSGQLNRRMPQMWYIDYVAGYAKNEVPRDICNVVAKLASVEVLGIAGEALRAGITSMSTSIDGLSESVGTSISGTSTLYSARIKLYKDSVDEFFDPKKSGARTAERGFTFTVL